MASTQEFVDFVLEQIQHNNSITAKKMFGEYAVYADGQLFGVICDDKLFIKPTAAGRAFLGDDLVEAPPYKGAKSSFLIEEKLEDAEWLRILIAISLPELPKPKKKKATKQ